MTKCVKLIILALIIGLFFTATFAVDKTNNLKKAPGIITSIVVAKSIDQKTGAAIDITSEFSATDKDIILVATLTDCKIGTRIEYVRYLNSKFLDHGSIKVKKANSRNVCFIWTLKKEGCSRLKGLYRIKTYANGMFEKEIFYTVN